MTNAMFSDLAIPPGEYLQEVLDELGMTQRDLARRMGRPAQAINEIAKGNKELTPETALELEQVTGVPAHIWSGLESDYRLTLARTRQDQAIEEETALVRNFPYKELAALRRVRPTRVLADRVKELRQFFGVASLRQALDLSSYAPAWRKSQHVENWTGSLTAWLRTAELSARAADISPFDAHLLEQSISTLRTLSRQEPNVFLSTLKQSLANCGVALIIQPHFPKTGANGASFWLKSGQAEFAVVVVTLRGKWADIFWFTLFHEIGHLLKHGRQLILENGQSDEVSLKREAEADQFAQETLIPLSSWKSFVGKRDFSSVAIANFANQIGIAPGIVTGRLTHDKLLPPNRHDHRVQYVWA